MPIQETSTLLGAALAWAVAKAYGFVPAKKVKTENGFTFVPATELEYSKVLVNPEATHVISVTSFTPEIDIFSITRTMEFERMTVVCGDQGCTASTGSFEASGVNVAQAVLRCLVKSRLGDQVEIPEQAEKWA